MSFFINFIIVFFSFQYKIISRKFKHKINLSSPKVAHYLGTLGLGGMERGVSIMTALFANRNVKMIVLNGFKSPKEFKLSSKVKRYIILLKLQHKIIINYNYLKQIIIDNKINILVNHENDKIGNEISKLAHNIGLKVIFFCHSTFIDRSYKYKNLFFHQKNYGIYISLVNFNILYFSSIKKINSLLITNQLNFNLSYNLPPKNPSKNIIMIGRPNPVKNFEFGIDVISEVHKKIKDVKLQIVGLIRYSKSSYTKKIINKIKKLGLSKNIFVTESQLDIEPFYRNSSIYLMCSHFEAFPNVVSEAKSHGLVTIVVGTTYVTPANKGTINIFNYDINKTAKEIVNLFSNESYLIKMRKFAFENRVEITNDELLDRWMKIYKSLLMNKTTDIKMLKLKLNEYSDKRYLELDSILKRERDDKENHRIFY